MLSVQDILVRLRTSGRALAIVIAPPRREELPERVLGLLDRLTESGGRSPLEAACRALYRGGLPETELVGVLLDRERRWFRPFMQLLELGERRGLWSVGSLGPGVTGSLLPVWTALRAEGAATVLAVYLDRFLTANGRECFQEALAVMQAGTARPARDAAAPTPPPASVPARDEVPDFEVDEELEELEELDPEEESPDPAATAPGASWLQSLSTLNVNQCREKTSTAGWLTKGANPELFLLIDQVPAALLEELRALGLLLMEAQGQSAGARGFVVRAGKLKFRGVAAINLPRLRELSGPRFQEMTKPFYGAVARTYEVTVLGPCGEWRESIDPTPVEETAAESEEPAPTPAAPAAVEEPMSTEAAPEQGELPFREPEPAPAPPCPRCGAALKRKKVRTSFWVCTGRCGFACQAAADGRPAEPVPCRSCGGPAYRTMDAMKRIRPACLNRCGGKGKKEAA